MRARRAMPSLVSMWMLDVFCCALGCVTLLWLLKTREANQAIDEAGQSLTLLQETRTDLAAEKARVVDLRSDAEKLRADYEQLGKMLATVREELDLTGQRLAVVQGERDANAKTLALTDEELKSRKKDLAAARGELDKAVASLADTMKARDSAAATAKSSAEDLAKATSEIDRLSRKSKAEQAKLDAADLTIKDAMAARAADAKKADELAARLAAMGQDLGEAKTAQAKLAEAKQQIIDLQSNQTRLNDKLKSVQAEAEKRFAGIATTGKNIVFLLDTSGSMDREDEANLDGKKWPFVRDSILKVMRSLPDIEKFQVITFSSRAEYINAATAGQWIPFKGEESIAEVGKALTAVRPQGDTNLYSAMEEAFRFRAKGMDALYLFSDGLPTSGPGLTAAQVTAQPPLRATERSELLSRHIRDKLASDWNRPVSGEARAKINAVGFFYESPEVGAFLWALSRENDGAFVGMGRPK